MLDSRTGSDANVVMPVGDLHGRAIWTEDGERLGTVRAANTDEDGRIVSFDVRERWILGAHHEVPAAGMRMDGGDVIVPTSAAEGLQSRRGSRRHRDDDEHASRRHSTAGASPMPVLLAGREGARSRFGGFDLLASLFGALVTIASLVLVGGVLGAVFGSEPANLDTSVAEASSLATEALLIGAVTLLLSSFLGGWCAGRSARFDGVRNGLLSVAWVVAIVVALGALGAWLGDQYDVLAGTSLPSFTADEYALWGVLGLLAALALMLVGAGLGGRLGEGWHRRADRSMLDVVQLDQESSRPSGERVVVERDVHDRDGSMSSHRRSDDERPRPLM